MQVICSKISPGGVVKKIDGWCFYVCLSLRMCAQTFFKLKPKRLAWSGPGRHFSTHRTVSVSVGEICYDITSFRTSRSSLSLPVLVKPAYWQWFSFPRRIVSSIVLRILSGTFFILGLGSPKSGYHSYFANRQFFKIDSNAVKVSYKARLSITQESRQWNPPGCRLIYIFLTEPEVLLT